MNEKKTDTQNMVNTPAIKITVEKGESSQIGYVFHQSFKIGRDETCDLQLTSSGISRFHAEVFLKQGQWWIRDLNSTNGTYFSGNRITELPLEKEKSIVIGLESAVLLFKPEELAPHQVTQKDRPPTVDHFVEHYFGDSREEGIGDHTRMIRSAFQEVQKKSKKKYYIIIATIGILLIISGIYGFQKHRQVEKQKQLAENIFYAMKTLELEVGALQKDVEISQDASSLAEVRNYRLQQREMSENYDKFLKELHIYDEGKLDETEELILRVARIFGECELTIPKDFMGEVKNYIKKWQTTDRLKRAIARAEKNGYAEQISKIMIESDLPPQFFYLGLQESDFRQRTVGPKTRYGIAKGIWQFIPKTALKYGLKTGPLVEIEKYDPRDDRFDFSKATLAAAKYIKDIYSTDAQASGLLVAASYNWGERKVASIIRKMPQNPKERNFWKLLKEYRQDFPLETYNYVFYIFSAAVIGENPELFGFEFANPLEHTRDNYYGSY